MRFFIVILAVLLTGCPLTSPVTPSAPVVVAPVGTATQEHISALERQLVELRKLFDGQASAMQSVSGEVYGVVAANAHNPDGAPKTLVASFAAAGSAGLPVATDAQKLAKGEQVLRGLNGELAAVVAELKGAQAQAAAETEARKQAEAVAAAHLAAIAKLKADAIAEQERARQELQTAFDRKQKELEASITALKTANQALQDKETALIVKACIGIGSLFLAASLGAAVFLIWSGGMTPKNIGACAAGFAAAGLSFAMSRFLAHPWIPYAVGGIIILIVLVVAVVLAKEHFDLRRAAVVAEENRRKLTTSIATTVADLKASPLAAEVKQEVMNLIDVPMAPEHQDAIRLEQAKIKA